MENLSGINYHIMYSGLNQHAPLASCSYYGFPVPILFQVYCYLPLDDRYRWAYST